MDENNFDEASYHREKYEKPPEYWNPDIFQKRYRIVVKAVARAIDDTEHEFQTHFSTTSDIDAAVIYGSWANSEGEEIWVHDGSDLDMYAVTRGDVKSITDTLKKKIRVRLDNRVPLDLFGDIDYRNPDSLSKVQKGEEVFKPGQKCVVVLPRSSTDRHEEIRRFFDQTGLAVKYEVI